MPELLIERPADAVALVRLNRPEQLNALNNALRSRIADAFEDLGGDGAGTAIVVTGNEKAFAAGADLKELLARSSDEQRHFLQPPHIYSVVEGLRKPVVAALNGHALGAGLELATACDLRVCSEKAKLGQPELNFAIIPGGGGTQRLVRLVGHGAASRLVLTGDAVDAAEALRIGLVERVVPVAELPSAALALARTIAEKAPVALRYAKEAVVGGLGLPLEDGIRLENDLATLLRTTEDRVEGARAFVEKRKPRWMGR